MTEAQMRCYLAARVATPPDVRISSRAERPLALVGLEFTVPGFPVDRAGRMTINCDALRSTAGAAFDQLVAKEVEDLLWDLWTSRYAAAKLHALRA